MSKDDTLFDAMRKINGACKLAIMAAINGNLPQPWCMSTLEALPAFGAHPIVLFASAERGNGDGYKLVGAKLEVTPPVDHLKLADELARQLCAKIRLAGPASVRIALDTGAIMPTRGTSGSSGYDLFAPIDVRLPVGVPIIVHSGVHIELPDDTWEAQIRPRSSMTKRGIIIPTGSVDSDYRGIVGATLINLSKEDQTIKQGERYAQMVIARVAHPVFEVVAADELSETERGDGGFGSTGK